MRFFIYVLTKRSLLSQRFSLTGSIPTEIGKFRNLQNINLIENKVCHELGWAMLPSDEL